MVEKNGQGLHLILKMRWLNIEEFCWLVLQRFGGSMAIKDNTRNEPFGQIMNKLTWGAHSLHGGGGGGGGSDISRFGIVIWPDFTTHN